MRSDTEYFRARSEQERVAAARATDQRARLRHLELAAAYVFRVREIEAMARMFPSIAIDISGRFVKAAAHEEQAAA
jgi:hypothetical protein